MTRAAVLSLFTGIGGLDLGLQRAGMTIAGQVEIDPWCRQILAKHWPEVPRHDDVRTCAEWWGDRPAPDLVAGGFPCQPVSLAGKGLAQADPRWLWPLFAGVVRDLRPRLVLVENVPGLLGRGMGDVLGDLASLGYDAEWDCISAAHIGAPHLRERIWIVAYADGGRLAEQPERDSEQVAGSESPFRYDAVGLRHDVADSASVGRLPRWPRRSAGSGQDGRRVEAIEMADATRIGRRNRPGVFRGVGTAGCGRWPAEPGVGRVAHGIPRRVDRLRGLGNAVVPQVAEHIGRLIIDALAVTP